MRKILPFALIFTLSLTFTSCITSFVRYSKVELVPDHPETQVSVLSGNHFLDVDSADLKKARLKNYIGSNVIRLEREGALPQTIALKSNRLNLLKLADFGLLGGAALYALKSNPDYVLGSEALIPASIAVATVFTSTWKVYKGPITLPELEEYPTRKEEGQMLGLGSVNIDLKEGALTTEYYANFHIYNKGKPSLSRYSSEAIKVEESLFSIELKKRLAQTGFVDTTQKIYSSSFAENTISANLRSAKTIIIGNILQVTGEVEWTLTNEYTGAKIAKYEIYGESIFSVHEKDADLIDDAVSASLADLFERTMVEFIKKPSVKEYIEQSSSKFDQVQSSWDSILILQNPDTSTSSVGAAMASVVTIVDKQSHGSGVVIGKNGYIITNHHVVKKAMSDERDLKVRFSSGIELEAKIIRANPVYDLALIKIEADSLITLSPLNQDLILVGSDVFAIGAPGSVDLGQTVSKGIISGKREDQGRVTIQTDVPINGGNSGGALVYKDGGLIGIVNAKIVGFGVEGIGFAIPAQYIESALMLDLK